MEPVSEQKCAGKFPDSKDKDKRFRAKSQLQGFSNHTVVFTCLNAKSTAPYKKTVVERKKITVYIQNKSYGV